MKAKRDDELPSHDLIIRKMVVGRKYRAGDMAQRFFCSSLQISKILKAMVDACEISTIIEGGSTRYFIPDIAIRLAAPGRGAPEFKPMHGTEAARLTFMANCLGIRRC